MMANTILMGQHTTYLFRLNVGTATLYFAQRFDLHISLLEDEGWHSLKGIKFLITFGFCVHT